MLRIVRNTDSGVEEKLVFKDKIEKYVFQKDLVGEVVTFSFTTDTGEVVAGRLSNLVDADKLLKELAVQNKKKKK